MRAMSNRELAADTPPPERPFATWEPPQWLDSLRSASPLYAVDMDQRIVFWGDCASSRLCAEDSAVGRYCYEVVPGVDPRNAGRCRANCQVIAMARAGRAAPDFRIWGALDGRGQEPQRIDVSVLLHEGTRAEDRLVVHLLRCAYVEAAPCEPSEPSCPPRTNAGGGAQPVLTPRQLEILARLADGQSPDAIARSLGVSRVTVRNHVQAAMERLGARTRLEAAMIAARTGLLSVPTETPSS